MAKKYEQYEREITSAIKKYKIMFISHIFGYYTELGRSQFYNIGLDKSDKINEAIQQNRSKASGYLVNKWIASDISTLQIAGYKLICTEEERLALSQEYVRMDANVDNKRELTAEEAKAFLEKLNEEV